MIMYTPLPFAGCIAATPVDTAMGITFLSKAGYNPLPFPLSSTPEEQGIMQALQPELLQKKVENILDELQKKNIGLVVIYCNSLSSVLNIPLLRKKFSLRIITPFDVYERYSKLFSHVACVAANAPGLFGVSRELQRYNSNIRLLGYANLDIVQSIEQGKSAELIIKQTGLDYFIQTAHVCSADVLLLACTHFPVLTHELQKQCMSLSPALEVKDIDMGLSEIL